MRMEATNKIGVPLPKKKVYIVISKNECCNFESYGCIEKAFTNKTKARQYLKECEERNIFSSVYYDIEECEIDDEN